MGFFFKPGPTIQGQAQAARFASIDSAFADFDSRVDRSDDVQVRQSARKLRDHLASTETAAPAAKEDPNWFTIVGVFVLLVGTFWFAYYLEGLGGHTKASDNLFTAFQVLFTAYLAIFGLENVKSGKKS